MRMMPRLKMIGRHFRAKMMMGDACVAYDRLPNCPNYFPFELDKHTMRRFTWEGRSQIENFTGQTVRRLQRLQVSFRLNKYTQDRLYADQGAMEIELHSKEYPVRASGIVAARAILSALDKNIGTFYFGEELVAPEAAVPEFWDFPLAAASAAYVFTIIEDYGNTIAKLNRPISIRQGSSWHAPIYGDLNLSDRAAVDKARGKVAAIFQVSRSRIPVRSIRRMVWLKRHRNAYAHEMETSVDFEQFFTYSLSMVCQVAFLCGAWMQEIKEYPYEDFEHRYS